MNATNTFCACLASTKKLYKPKDDEEPMKQFKTIIALLIDMGYTVIICGYKVDENKDKMTWGLKLTKSCIICHKSLFIQRTNMYKTPININTIFCCRGCKTKQNVISFLFY